MITLKNQTIYQCEYCGKRLLSKNGAKIHEKEYCKESPIVKKKRIEEISNCKHDWETHWTPIVGEEWRYEPDHSYCGICGVTEMELEQMEESK